MPTGDHHSEYLAQAVAGLTPEGHQRVDELLEQLMQAVGGREWLLRFAKARKTEADSGDTEISQGSEPGDMLTRQELDGLTVGFMTIRDQEPLDDVANWANAVLALLEDEAKRKPRLSPGETRRERARGGVARPLAVD
jgi:hypothetical protein